MDFIEIIKQFTEYGIFAGLFIYLFLSSQKRNDKRESNYVEIINEYSEKLENNTLVLKEVVETLDNIKEELKNEK